VFDAVQLNQIKTTIRLDDKEFSSRSWLGSRWVGNELSKKIPWGGGAFVI
jgi:hypothetical protein